MRDKNNLIFIIAVLMAVLSLANLSVVFTKVNNIKELTGHATDTGTHNLTIESTASINFTTDNINWGSGTVDTTGGETEAFLDTKSGTITNGNWTANSAGLVIENIGNVNVSLDIKTGKNAASFIGGSNPAYKWIVEESESGSCGYSVIITEQPGHFDFYYPLNESSLSDMATNGTDFWLLDGTNKFVHHVNSSGDNQTDGFGISYMGFPMKIATNGTDFWISDATSSYIYHLNSSGDNQTDSFSTSFAFPTDIATNGSDFWISNFFNTFVHHLNSSGDNQTDGFLATGLSGVDNMETNGSDFWIFDYADTPDQPFYQFNSSGDLVPEGGFLEADLLDALGWIGSGNGFIFWSFRDGLFWTRYYIGGISPVTLETKGGSWDAFEDVNTTSPGTSACESFGFINAADSLVIHLNVTIPYDSVPEAKGDVITATVTAI